MANKKAKRRVTRTLRGKPGIDKTTIDEEESQSTSPMSPTGKGLSVSIEIPPLTTSKRTYISYDDEEEISWIEKPSTPHAIPIVSNPKSSKRRIVSSAKQISPWPKWLPENMKIEILAINQGANNLATKAELMACIHTWVRRYFWQIRNLSREGRDEISIGFGANEAQVKEMENDACNQPFGNTVALKIENYHHRLMAALQENIDLLLKMFWNCKEAQGFISGQLMKVEAKKQAALLRETGGVNVRVRGLGLGSAPNTPIIDQDEVNKILIKGDMRLISDVWSYVLDVMDEGFLITNEVWGQRFLKSTCIILSWYITFLFQLPDPKAVMEDNFANGIEAANKTTAIYKGDLPLIEWPNFQQPVKWGNRVPAVSYGALVGSKGFEQVVPEEGEDELLMEYSKSMNIGNHDETKEKTILKLLDHGVDIEAANMEKLLIARAGVLEKLSKESTESAKSLMEKVVRIGAWMKEKKAMSEWVFKGRMALTAIDQFTDLASKAYEQAAEAERRKQLDGGIGRAESQYQCLEVLATYNIWFNKVKSSGILEELGLQYEACFPPLQSSNWGWSGSQGLGPFSMNQHQTTNQQGQFHGNQGGPGGFQGFSPYGQQGSGYAIQQGWTNGTGMGRMGGMGFVGSSGMGDSGLFSMGRLLGPSPEGISSGVTSRGAMSVGPQERGSPSTAGGITTGGITTGRISGGDSHQGQS